MIIIGICGGSGSGKTTFARQLLDQLGDQQAAILAQDHYYLDRSGQHIVEGEGINFDHPEAIEFSLLAQHIETLKQNQSIHVPVYDFAGHIRLKQDNEFLPLPIVIVEGTLILSDPLVYSTLDYSLFIDIPTEIRFERRLRRDVAERGRTPEGVKRQFFQQVEPMYEEFVFPSGKKATWTMNDNGDSPLFIEKILEKLAATN